jgi:hypothetical protein
MTAPPPTTYTQRTTYLNDAVVPAIVRTKAVPSFKRLLVEMFYTHWEKFTRQLDRTQANAAISAYATRFQTQDLTDHTASILASEPATDAKTIRDLISEECSRQIRTQTNRLTRLEQFNTRTAANTAKNLLKGPPSASAPNKQTMETPAPKPLKSILKKTTDPIEINPSPPPSTSTKHKSRSTKKQHGKPSSSYNKPTVARKQPPKAKHTPPTKSSKPTKHVIDLVDGQEHDTNTENDTKKPSKNKTKPRHSKNSSKEKKIFWSDKSKPRPGKRSDS